MAADEDADVFEITDFTTASEWERFIAKFEEVLHEWKLVNRLSQQSRLKQCLNGTVGEWRETADEIAFADFKFLVTHHRLEATLGSEQPTDDKITDDCDEDRDTPPDVLPDMMNMDGDFPSRAHCISRWYGLQEFVTICPSTENIDSESRIKLLLSSVSIALNNSNSCVPVFIQTLQKWRRVYTGVSIHAGITTDFEMVHLKKPPSQYNHLAGLLNAFKSKLGVSTPSLPPVSVSVRFTYVLQDWVNSPWPQTLPDIAAIIDDRMDCPDLHSLPFGACEDPVKELHLSCTWPCLAEQMIVENQAYTDLDPLQAPQWSVRVQMRENPRCLLGEYLGSFLQLCGRTETTHQLLGNIDDDDEPDPGADISHALQRLTEPGLSYTIPTISSVVTSARSRLRMRPDEAPIREDVLNSLLLFLFPDAAETPPKGDEDQTQEGDPELTNELSAESVEFLKEAERQLKSSPVTSLIARLAVCSCIVNHEYGGLRAVAHLWQEFIMEMRYRWDKAYTIIGVEEGSPNLGSCLLHQKLQMLNCCIERRKKHEDASSQQSDRYEMNEDQPASESDDDEFFECEDISQSNDSDENNANSNLTKHGLEGTDKEDKSDVDLSWMSDDKCSPNFNENLRNSTESKNGVASTPQSVDLSRDDSFHSARSVGRRSKVAPEGRLCQCGDLILINSKEPLFVPITQEPSQMTEDMLDQHAEVLTRLGTTSEGALLRAKMQSACLLSDMESFKAANPGCLLEDFVRWYSPRDWIEHSTNGEASCGIRGELSHRMQIPGNMWQEVWSAAKSVPARRQKRLFDETKEAEKVLHFLSSLAPSQVIMHLLPPLFHAALITITKNEFEDVPNIKHLLSQMLNKMLKATRSPDQDIRRYTGLHQQMCLAETVIARAKSLRSKFTEDLLEVRGGEGELRHFVSSLLQNSEVPVRGGPLGPSGTVIHKMFVAAQKAAHMIFDDDSPPPDRPSSTVSDFPKAAAREYILRSTMPRPAPFSRPSPHRMYCILMDSEFRLAGAFSKDTTFQ